MTPNALLTLHNEVQARGGFFPLPNQTILALTGADRERYLNGQCTNSIPKATPDAAIYTMLPDAKGKVSGDAFVSILSSPEILDSETASSLPLPAILLDSSPSQQDSLHARIDRYIIADDVEIQDLTNSLHLTHLIPSSQAPSSTPDPFSSPAPVPLLLRKNNRFGAPNGIDIFSSPNDTATLHQFLTQSQNHLLLPEEYIEFSRINAGIPLWNRDLTPENIPNEADPLDRAIDFHKGCYIGQEVISKIKSIGSPSRSLVHLISNTTAPLPASADLLDPTPPHKIAGKITSSSYSFNLDKSLGLGYVKRNYCNNGTQLLLAIPNDTTDTNPNPNPQTSQSPILLTVQNILPL